ncbi:MAG: hypothetical protein E2598_06150 [Sphingobium sp.]|nr:hypothetical protein [Sphingobium sp.]
MVESAFTMPASAQAESTLAASPAVLPYSDLADLVTGSPLVAKAYVERVRKVDLPGTSTQPEPQKYLLIEARIDALIRGDGGLPPLVSFLAPALSEQDKKTSIWRKKQVILLFAHPGSKAGEVRLTSSRHAAQRWNAEMENTVRNIATELVASDSPPAVTGIGDAFHTAGTISGEGETQIFLKTTTSQPVSISITRRPGQKPHWGVSLGEIVDESALPPSPDTLLWYRLACSLPARLPASAVRGLPLLDAEAAHRDYRLVIESLGSCGRTL